MLMLPGNLVKIDDRTARLGLSHPTVPVSASIKSQEMLPHASVLQTFLTQPPPEDETFSRYFMPYAGPRLALNHVHHDGRRYRKGNRQIVHGGSAHV